MSKSTMIKLAVAGIAGWYLFFRKGPPPADAAVSALNKNPTGVVRGNA
jgi:hypothetical protein